MRPLWLVFQEYSWIHMGIGLIGNVLFFTGSILFLPALEPYKPIGVGCFIIGSFLMLIGAIGRFVVDIYDRKR